MTFWFLLWVGTIALGLAMILGIGGCVIPGIGGGLCWSLCLGCLMASATWYSLAYLAWWVGWLMSIEVKVTDKKRRR